MAKTRRLISENLKQVIWFGNRGRENPEKQPESGSGRVLEGKPSCFCSQMDLSDEAQTRLWQNYYEDHEKPTCFATVKREGH
jgi:hypothetical protein